MDRLSQYRKHARDCREAAEHTRDEAEREALHELATHWDAIVDIHERLRPVKPRGD